MKKDKLIIVGIGASAGGLEALQSFVKYLPTDTNIAYIVAQHLSPTYKSLMVDLLAKDSTIQIKEAQFQEKIEANTMYICPPNKNILIEDNEILLIEPKQLSYGPKPSINILFESIAANKGNKAIGIILSGTGSDGSVGVRAIKAEGGFTIVQQPQNAKYDGMPNNAINTGNIDLILDAEVMGTEIVEILRYPDKTSTINNINEKTQIYKNILAHLKRIKEIDFSLYKFSTIQRRIERRMSTLKLTNLHDYSEHLFENENETEALFKDILISVTRFFRDTKAFEILKEHLGDLIKKKKDSNIRIWTPGCSTGEEVYSIAIILNEILADKIANYKIQIFATDIDESSIAFARIGKYPESALIKLDKTYIKKYFTIKDEEYEVKKSIRDMCIFTKHDITNDPAFMKLDLISCRNLLIYFTNELQQRIFPMFHYSLKDKGILLLGKSESIGNFNSQFRVIDKKHKLYEAVHIGAKTAPSPLRAFISRPSSENNLDMNENSISTITDMMVEHIQRYIIPMSVVVNESFDMIYIKGKNPYLMHPEGEITQNILKNINSELSVELRIGLHLCKKENILVKTPFQKVLIEKELQYVRMIIAPLDNSLSNDLFLICFEENSEDLKNYDMLSSNLESTQEIEKLQIELSHTREHLQTVIEEFEMSNQEMLNLNAELQSVKEELQTAYTEMLALYEQRDKDIQKLSKK